MKHPHPVRLFVSLLALGLMGSGTGRSQQPAYTAVPSSDPAFRTLVPVSADAVIGGRATELMPYGVILHNTSEHSIVAYAVKWDFDDGSGNPVGAAQVFLQLFSFADHGNANFAKLSPGTIPPGKSRLITPGFNLLLPVALHQTTASPFQSPAAIAEKADEFARYAKSGPFRGTTVTAYVLDDGSCYADADADLCEVVAGQMDSIQDLVEFVLGSDLSGDRTSAGAALQSYVATPRSNRHPLSEAYNTAYTMTQRNWGDTVRRQLASKAAEGDIRQYLGGLRYAVRPVFTKYPK